MGYPGDPDNKETLFDKMREDEQDDEDIRPISKEELKRLVFSLLDKRANISINHMLGKLSEYRVNGLPVNELDIISLKNEWQKEQDRENQPPPEVSATQRELGDDKVKEIDKRYQIYKELKAEDPEFARKLLADGFGIQKLDPRPEPSTPRTPMEQAGDQMTAMVGLIKAVRDLDGGNNPPPDPFEELDKWMERFKTLGIIRDNEDGKGAMMWDGQVLSDNPQTALAQVVAKAIDDGVTKLDGTAREALGLRKAKIQEKTLKKDKKKVEQTLRDLEAVADMYSFCLVCSVGKCAKCTKSFYLNGQNPSKGLKCPHCGQVGEDVEMTKPTFVLKGAVSCAKCGTHFIKNPIPGPDVKQKQVTRAQQADEFIDLSEDEDEEDEDEDEEEDEMDQMLDEWLDEADGYLYKLKRKIKHKHDPVKTGRLAFYGCVEDTDQVKRLLFIARKGSEYVSQLFEPMLKHYNVQDIYDFYQKRGTKQYLKKMFREIKRLAKDEGITLSNNEMEEFEKTLNEELNKHKQDVEPPRTKPTEREKRKGKIVHTTPPNKNEMDCPICGERMPLEEFQTHCDTAHSHEVSLMPPKPPKGAKPRMGKPFKLPPPKPRRGAKPTRPPRSPKPKPAKPVAPPKPSEPSEPKPPEPAQVAEESPEEEEGTE